VWYYYILGFFANADKATNDLVKFVDSNELLSDYGGNGPSYDDVLASQQIELGDGCTRFIVEHMIVNKKESNFKFKVQKDEKVHSIVVYTKSDYHADFSVKKGTQTVIKTTKVCRDVKTGQGKSNHYSVELVVPATSPMTEGEYSVVAHGSQSKDHYLVAISLCPK
jgi:hypothetical protein